MSAERTALKEALDLAGALKAYADPNDPRRATFNEAWELARDKAAEAAKVWVESERNRP